MKCFNKLQKNYPISYETDPVDEYTIRKQTIDIRDKINQSDLILWVTLAGAFTTLWYFLYSTIVESTMEDPLFYMYLSYSIIHFYVTCCLTFSLFFAFIKSRLLAERDPLEYYAVRKITEGVYYTFLTSWMPVLIFSILLICGASFHSEKTDWIAEGIIAFYVIYLMVILVKELKKDNWYGIILAYLTLGYLIFILIMTVVSANVKITTDKEGYTSEENIIVTLTPQGYIFLPPSRLPCL